MRRLHSDVRAVLDLEPADVLARNHQRAPHTPWIELVGQRTGRAHRRRLVSWRTPVGQRYDSRRDRALPLARHERSIRVAHVADQAQRLRDAGDYAVVATPWLLFPFERAHAMQGMDKFLINMMMAPDFAHALLRKITDLCKTLMGNFLAECGDLIDIIKIGDDLGTQNSLMISPKMYRQFLKPLHAEFISFIKARTQAKVFFHTDGDVFDLIPDFIEMGIDILNPIQTSAGRMSNLAELKRRFGQNMVFCGAVDTHRVLPYGTPDDVRQELRRVMNVLGPGGGYMVASVHTIMNDVPAENILAMVDAVEEFGKYPLS